MYAAARSKRSDAPDAPLLERLLGAHRLERLRATAGEAPDGLFPFRYEYNEFVQPLETAPRIVRRTEARHPDAVLRIEAFVTAIEVGVHELLDRVAPDGWRPACATDVAALVGHGCVEVQSRRRGLLGLYRELALVSLNIPCERVVWEL